MPSMCAYGLVKKEFSSQIVELVDKRICVVFFGGVTFIGWRTLEKDFH